MVGKALLNRFRSHHLHHKNALEHGKGTVRACIIAHKRKEKAVERSWRGGITDHHARRRMALRRRVGADARTLSQRAE